MVIKRQFKIKTAFSLRSLFLSTKVSFVITCCRYYEHVCPSSIRAHTHPPTHPPHPPQRSGGTQHIAGPHFLKQKNSLWLPLASSFHWKFFSGVFSCIAFNSSEAHCLYPGAPTTDANRNYSLLHSENVLSFFRLYCAGRWAPSSVILTPLLPIILFFLRTGSRVIRLPHDF